MLRSSSAARAARPRRTAPEPTVSVATDTELYEPEPIEFGPALEKVLRAQEGPAIPAAASKPAPPDPVAAVPGPAPEGAEPPAAASVESAAAAGPASGGLDGAGAQPAQDVAADLVASAPSPDAVTQIYRGLVEAAGAVFEAAANGATPDSPTIVTAVRQALNLVRRDDELLSETVRQRRDARSWSQRAANVAVLSMSLGLELECDERRCLAQGLCGLMHDVGMLSIPPEMLDSPRLNRAQLEQLRDHPNESQKMIRAFGSSFAWIGRIVVQAHERRDGSGYPRGLRGEQIHEVAGVLGLADTYEAMAHPRPDREARATYNALKEIIDKRNTHFERRYIKALISIVSIFPLGSLVKLNNGETGRVIKASRVHPTRPALEILLDPRGRQLAEARLINLDEEPMLYIVDPAIAEDVLAT